MMTIPDESVLLRIFCGEDDRHGHMPLYEAIILKAREAGLAGATMLRGTTGFGHSSRLHTTKILRLSQDLPIIIEIVDSREAVEAFLPTIHGMLGSALVTMEKVRVLKYSPGTRPAD